MVDLARQLADLFRQPGDVGQRREVSFFILADPAVDRLLRVAQGQGRLRGVVSVDLPPLVIPFAGERYAAMDRLTALLAPPYDVISRDRKSTRLNSSHLVISYAVFCLKTKPYMHLYKPTIS